MLTLGKIKKCFPCLWLNSELQVRVTWALNHIKMDLNPSRSQSGCHTEVYALGRWGLCPYFGLALEGQCLPSQEERQRWPILSVVQICSGSETQGLCCGPSQTLTVSRFQLLTRIWLCSLLHLHGARPCPQLNKSKIFSQGLWNLPRRVFFSTLG